MRESPVTFSDNHRSTEIGKSLHENHQRCGKNCRHGELENDFEEAVDTGAAHVGRGLNQRVIDVSKGTVHINEYQRKIFSSR